MASATWQWRCEKFMRRCLYLFHDDLLAWNVGNLVLLDYTLEYLLLWSMAWSLHSVFNSGAVGLMVYIHVDVALLLS